MKEKDLHTGFLEQIFGELTLEILIQNEKIRVIQILDTKKVSRTLGIVKFDKIKGGKLLAAHEKIISGGFLGKTLIDSNVDFTKDTKCTFNIILPDWAMSNFNTNEKSGLGIYSEIVVSNENEVKDEYIYCELIEIVPNGLKKYFDTKIYIADVFGGKINHLLERTNLGFKNVHLSENL